MKISKLLPLVLVFVFACQSGKSSSAENDGVISIDSLRSEVLFVHDEVMPKMGALRKVRMELMVQVDSLMPLDSAHAQSLATLATEIGDASEAMMQWMRAYEPEFEGTDEEIRAYLESQKVSIQKVKDQMEGALAVGEEALAKE